jgi:hypothetical protein
MYLHANAGMPDHVRDVIVHFTERCESRNDCKAIWTVYLGAQQEAEFEDQFEAMRFARSLADSRKVPAWRLGGESEGLVRLGG